jgi:hypothetical protein
MSWSEQEFSGADLGDARLKKRLMLISNTLSNAPEASIPGACGSWGETQGTYRFLSHADDPEHPLGWEHILTPHSDATVERMREFPLLLCLQDTTELNFNGQQIKGLGPLSYESQRGMYLHPTYVVTPNHEPLGVLDLWMWAREPKDSDGNRPGLKESRRWTEGYERVAERAEELPGVRLVYVADRESDLFELMHRAHELGHPADYVLRSKHDRALPEGGRLWASVKSDEPMGQIEFKMPARNNQPERTVRQQIWVRTCQISGGKKCTLTVTCVIACEINPPEGVKPLEWRLLTNRSVETLGQAMEIIDWYRCRWDIEVFFHVLKNGCRVEALQLSTRARLELALGIYLVVAWRVAYMQRMGRTNPHLPARVVFSQEEWRAAYILNKKKPPEEEPSIQEVVRLVARLGGFLGRKCDGEPGVKTLWRGYRRVRTFVEGLQNLRQLGIEG